MLETFLSCMFVGAILLMFPAIVAQLYYSSRANEFLKDRATRKDPLARYLGVRKEFLLNTWPYFDKDDYEPEGHRFRRRSLKCIYLILFLSLVVFGSFVLLNGIPVAD